MAKKPKPRPYVPTTHVRDYPAPPGLPTSVRINGQKYRIIYRAPLIRGDGSILHGMVDGYDRTILIDPTDPPHVIRETLLHEIAHVYIHNSDGIETKLSPQLLEALCDLFGASVCDLLDNNEWPTREP